MSVIAPGSPAPAFRLAREDGSSFTERDLGGTSTVLGFYPFAFAPVSLTRVHGRRRRV